LKIAILATWNASLPVVRFERKLQSLFARSLPVGEPQAERHSLARIKDVSARHNAAQTWGMIISPVFVRIAEGSNAVRVTKSSELAPALKRALTHKGTSPIDVIVDSAVPLLYGRKG
jgi:hypothetical protein